MPLFGGNLAYRVLRCISRASSTLPKTVDEYESAEQKLRVHFGHQFFDTIRDRNVIDFGSGHGRESVAIARSGATRVVGVEIQERFRVVAREHAAAEGVADRCEFVACPDEPADLIFSLDSFEHFDDPAAILHLMSKMICENGEVWISFGLPWYHPHGGHLFSVFPWAHLIFTEDSLIRWRSDFKDDGATRFHEVAGGLNQMTIARFHDIISSSSLHLLEFRLTPISKLRPIHCPWTREFTTSLIFARLQKVPAAVVSRATRPSPHLQSEMSTT